MESQESHDTPCSRGVKRANSEFVDEREDGGYRRKKINVIVSTITAALDRTNTGSRNATYIIVAVANSRGFNVGAMNLSHSAIHRYRQKHRVDIAKDLKDNPQVANCLVVHWDGKLLPQIVGTGSVERLRVVISSLRAEQLLDIPKLASGTGANLAAAVIEILNDWNLATNVRAMCFDTTRSNTGNI